MMFRTAAVPALAALALTMSIASAQQPPTPVVPEPTCVKPEFPGLTADSKRFDRFNKEYKTYSDCIKKYIDENKALADAIIATSNKVIKEFNTYNEEMAERQAARK